MGLDKGLVTIYLSRTFWLLSEGPANKSFERNPNILLFQRFLGFRQSFSWIFPLLKNVFFLWDINLLIRHCLDFEKLYRTDFCVLGLYFQPPFEAVFGMFSIIYKNIFAFFLALLLVHKNVIFSIDRGTSFRYVSLILILKILAHFIFAAFV